ncbi:kinase-like protein [Fomitiporia mediterranea MF3/22]|uniref:kinase-like protein n=1 Tax=Fomitiporia mediterranea (strain MF3/22) TaxID=694068 RepID=UPI0004407662|nr:kinase-like protein [Fomitiporia mediterranea MF3/22]EJD08606.1 kinase-like protein [Fomitiporia mediterranea MF3/22]
MGKYKPPILKRLADLNALKLQAGLESKISEKWLKPDLNLATLAPGKPHAIVGEPVQIGSFGAIYRVVYNELRYEVDGSEGRKREVNPEFAAKVIWKGKDMKGKERNQHEREDMKLKVLQEAKNLMKMSREHRHILTCYGVFESNDYWVLVTEYAQLGDLYDYYLNLDNDEHRGYLIGELMPRHFRQVSKAIVFLHHKEYIHRDIKLENFFLCLRGDPLKEVVVLGDLALYTNLVKMEKFRVGAKDVYGAEGEYGSPNYTAPEMLLHPDKPYTEAVDMWSLGANMYIFPSENFLYNHVAIELGKDPEKFTPQEAARKVVESHENLDNGSKGLIDVLLSKDPEGPSWIKLMTPDAIDFMRKCLELDPSKRMTAKEALGHPWLNIKGEKDGVSWDYDAKKEFKRLARRAVADPEIRKRLQSPSGRSESRQRSHGLTSNGTDPQLQAIRHHTASQASTNRTQSRVPSKSEAHSTAKVSRVGKDQTTPTVRTTSRVLSEAKEHRTKSGLSTGKDRTAPTACTPTKVLSEAKANRTESSASARKDKPAPAARTSSKAPSEAKGNTTARELSAGKDQTGQVHHRVGSNNAPKASSSNGGIKEGAEGMRSRHTSQVDK